MKYSRTMTPDDTIQACLAEEKYSINVFLYPGDIQPWVDLWEKDKSAQNFANWLLTQLKDPGTIGELLQMDKDGLLKRLKKGGYAVDNLAQIPGYLQAKAQRDAKIKRRVRPVIAENAEQACTKIHELKENILQVEGREGEIRNLIIESHGEHGEGFYIGEYDDKGSNFYTANRLALPFWSSQLVKLASDVKGKIVLMGCELGTNDVLLQKVANITQRPVIASKGWVSDWPGMFNDEQTRPAMNGMQVVIAELVAEYAGKNYGEVLRKDAGCLAWFASDADIKVRIRKEVLSILNGFFDSTAVNKISPSGSADAVVDEYYLPEWPNREISNEYKQKTIITERMMNRCHGNVGKWVEVEPAKASPQEGKVTPRVIPMEIKVDHAVNRKKPQAEYERIFFYFDPDGEPCLEFGNFHNTKFGKAYDSLIKNTQKIQRSQLEKLKRKGHRSRGIFSR